MIHECSDYFLFSKVYTNTKHAASYVRIKEQLTNICGNIFGPPIVAEFYFCFWYNQNIYIKCEGGVQKLATKSQSDSPHPQLHAEEIYKFNQLFWIKNKAFHCTFTHARQMKQQTCVWSSQSQLLFTCTCILSNWIIYHNKQNLRLLLLVSP